MELHTLLKLEQEKQGVITKLNLSNRSLTEIPSEVLALTELEELVLRNNQLTELPKSLFELKRLTTLDLKKNNIVVLPDEISHLTRLQILNLVDNQLSKLPLELFSLESLDSLLLGNNKIQEIPYLLNQLKNLRILNLQSNDIEEIPIFIRELQQLESLHLEKNKLILVPAVIWDLPKLHNFTWKKQRGIIPPQKANYYEEVKQVILVKKGLTEIPEIIFKFTNLKRLILSENKLQELPEKISNLQYLEDVVLNNNQLTTLPLSFFKLKQIQHLNLSQNSLKKYPYEVLGFDQLQGLITSGNAFEKKKDTSHDLKILKVIEAIKGFNFNIETRKNIFAIFVDSIQHYPHIPKDDFYNALQVHNWNIFYNASSYLIHVIGDFSQPKYGDEIVFVGEQFLLDQENYIKQLQGLGIRCSTEFTANTTHAVLTFPLKKEPIPYQRDIVFLDEQLLNHFLNQKEPKYFQTQQSEEEKKNVIQLLNHPEDDNYEIGVELLFSLGVSHDLLYHIIISLFIRHNTDEQKIRLKQLLYLYGSENLYRIIRNIPHTLLTKWNFSKRLQLICTNTELDINVFYRFVDKNRI